MSLINDALKKAQSLQAAAAQQPPAAPPPAPAAAPAPAPAATTPPLKLSLATPAPAPAAPAPAAAPRLTLAPAAPATPTAPIKLSLATPAAPTASTDAAPVSAPAAPTPPVESATAAPAATPAPNEDDSLESLRQLYKQAGHDDATANEKAIAARALDPTGLKLALPPVVAPAAPATAAGAVSTTPLQPAGAAPAPAVNPLTGLRAPTPEAAAAFLASHPISHPTTPAPGASILDLPPTTGDGTPPPVPARSAPPPTRRKKSANPETVLLWVGSVLAIVLGGGLTAAYLLLRDPAKPATDVTAEAAETSDADAPPPPPPDTAAPAPVATTPEPAPAPTPEATPADAAPADPAPEVAAEPPPPPPPPPRINRPDPTILAWVQKIELTGIRGGASPKVFMNGKLYDVGETVNYDFSLKLTVVQGKLLIFEDAEGNTYEYRF